MQAQTGVPYALLDGRFAAIPETYRLHGRLTGEEARAGELAAWCEDLIRTVRSRVDSVPRDRRPRVYYARGPRGLDTGLGGSINVETIEFMGAVNVAGGTRGGLATVSLEQVLAWDPEVIVTIDQDFAANVRLDPSWAGVRAVRAGRVHLSPKLPFGWVDFPPSVNRLPGLVWLGKLIYPDLFPEDLTAFARYFHARFYHRTPTDAQLAFLLAGADEEERVSGRFGAAGGLAVGFGAVCAAVLLAFAVGRFPVGVGDLAGAVWARLLGGPSGLPPAAEAVIFNIRGPRVVAAVLCGAALAVAGAAFQGLFRNPLVSPDILGASSGAALGAVVGIYLSLGVLGIQGLAFAGGLVAVALVYLIGSSIRSGDLVLVLVLTGIVVGSLLGAGVGLMKYLADPYNQLPAMTFWLLGSLAGTDRSDLLPLFGPVAFGAAILFLLRWRMNVMSLPEEEARALGLSTGPLRLAIVAAATLVTAASVAAAGVIGWVGLVVPHLARFLVGPDFGRLIPTAALLGGGYMLLIDTIARSAASVEIPLGILTAVIGTPVFIWLLISARKGWS